MTYDVVTIDSSDREHVRARRVSLEQAPATAREYCRLPPDAVGIVEDGCTVYRGEDEVFATVVLLER